MSAETKPLIATIYNPHNQAKAELVAGFVVRKRLFERIFEDIKSADMKHPEQHYMIQGVRGMGKTTLLLRIAYEVENTPDLAWLIPLVFNEEEYGIASLADVWEKIAQYLEEQDDSFSGIYEKMINLYESKDYERKAFDLLIKTLQSKQKKILLLIDNFGVILKKLEEKEAHRLREILITTPEIRLIGATSVYLEDLFDYQKPFYDFFKFIYLKGLDKTETQDLMLKLGEAFHAEEVKRIVEEEPGRLETLRRLTGGVVRTMVLLFEIFMESNTGSAFKDLEVLLDRVTPLYKHRMDDLPTQQQKIVAALADAWDAANTKELAKATRMESKVVSAQLGQLVDNQVVIKIETTTKNHLYQLEERFFNIWYLMRFGRKTDQRILWLVKFFEEMFAGDEEMIRKRILKHLRAMYDGSIDGKAAFYLTEVFSVLATEIETENLLKSVTKDYLINNNNAELAKELTPSDQEKIDNANSYIKDKNYEEAAQELESVKRKDKFLYLDIAMCCYLSENKEKTKEAFGNLILRNGKKVYLKVNEVTVAGFLPIYLIQKKGKKLALDLANKLIDYVGLFGHEHLLIFIWNEEFDIVNTLLSNIIFGKNIFYDTELIKFLLAKKQYYIVYNYFQDEKLKLKDLFKPLYYATMYYLIDEYPNEYLRMGSELKESVEELIKQIEQMAIDYA